MRFHITNQNLNMELSIRNNPVTGYIIIKKGRRYIARMDTLSFYRKDAIEKILKGTTMSWEELKRYNWIVKKVSITYSDAPPFTDIQLIFK